MKKKSLKRRSPYFFGLGFHRTGSSSHMPELIKSESELQRVETSLEEILRWADDGGKMLDLGNLTARSKPDDTGKRRNQR